jgi:hypothetical protein
MINWFKNLFVKKDIVYYKKLLLKKYNIPESKLELYKTRISDHHTIQRLAIWYYNDKGNKRYFTVVNRQVYEL